MLPEKKLGVPGVNIACASTGDVCRLHFLYQRYLAKVREVMFLRPEMFYDVQRRLMECVPKTLNTMITWGWMRDVFVSLLAMRRSELRQRQRLRKRSRSLDHLFSFPNSHVHRPSSRPSTSYQIKTADSRPMTHLPVGNVPFQAISDKALSIQQVCSELLLKSSGHTYYNSLGLL